MKDCKGKELALGDYVAFVHGASSSPSLETGHVTNISASGRECSVDGKSHIYRNRVMKLPKEMEDKRERD